MNFFFRGRRGGAFAVEARDVDGPEGLYTSGGPPYFVGAYSSVRGTSDAGGLFEVHCGLRLSSSIAARRASVPRARRV